MSKKGINYYDLIQLLSHSGLKTEEIEAFLQLMGDDSGNPSYGSRIYYIAKDIGFTEFLQAFINYKNILKGKGK
jgi:hypothetical protein